MLKVHDKGTKYVSDVDLVILLFVFNNFAGPVSLISSMFNPLIESSQSTLLINLLYFSGRIIEISMLLTDLNW